MANTERKLDVRKERRTKLYSRRCRRSTGFESHNDRHCFLECSILIPFRPGIGYRCRDGLMEVA